MQQVIPNMVNTVMHIESNKDLLGINTTEFSKSDTRINSISNSTTLNK